MLLANPFQHDTRVYKEARALVDCGCEVHVLAMSAPGLPETDETEGIRTRRLGARKDPRSVLFLMRLLALWPFPAAMRRALLRAAQTPADGRVSDDGADSFDSPASLRAVPRNIRTAVHRYVRRLTPKIAGFNAACAIAGLGLHPDIVHAHDLTTLVAGTILKRVTSSPLVYDSHELFLERNIGDRPRFMDKIKWGPLECFGIRQADTVITVSEGIARHLRDHYNIRKPFVVRNTQPYASPRPRERVLHEELGIPEDRRIAIYPGAITYNRGLEALIDSTRYMPGVACVIMGYAQSDAYLRDLLERARTSGRYGISLFFRDAVSLNDVGRYIASADVGVVPTPDVCLSYRYESSNKIYHCIMAGVPLAMSNHGEKRLLVQRYGIGRLFDESDPRDIARVIQDLAHDRVLHAKVRARCLEATRIFSWERDCLTLHRAYDATFGVSPERADRRLPTDAL